MNELAKNDGGDAVTFGDAPQVGVVILADVSASMWGNRIDRLRAELGVLWTEIGGRAKLFAFSDEVAEVAGPADLPHPSGSTDLAAAIRKANRLFPSVLFVISDGSPDDAEDALRAAEEALGEINVLFVGSPENERTLTFMRRLAEVGGGQMISRDLGKGQPILADMRAILALAPPTAP